MEEVSCRESNENDGEKAQGDGRVRSPQMTFHPTFGALKARRPLSLAGFDVLAITRGPYRKESLLFIIGSSHIVQGNVVGRKEKPNMGSST